MRRTLATLTIVALFSGVSVTAVSVTAVSATAADAASESALRASVDTVGNRFFAAKEAVRVLDEEMRALDRTLARSRSRVEALHPMAKATAVQLYQGSAQGFSGMFDVADAMESARRSELIARAGDHTQAVLDRYVNAVRILQSQRTQLERARAKQVRVAFALAKQKAELELLLAKAQQAYRNRLAALARANAAQANSTASGAGAPTARAPFVCATRSRLTPCARPSAWHWPRRRRAPGSSSAHASHGPGSTEKRPS